MLNTESVANTRLSVKTLSVIFFIIVFSILIDVTVDSLVEVYYVFSTSPAGLSLYVAITGVLVVGTYVMLKMTEKRIREQRMKKTYDNRIAKVV